LLEKEPINSKKN